MSDITVNRSVAPNIEKLGEELDVLGLGALILEPPISYPGDIIAKYEDTLTGAQQTSVSDTITNHDETLNVSEQDRTNQDTIDLDQIRSDYDNWSTLTDAQIKANQKLLNRCLLRNMRNEAI